MSYVARAPVEVPTFPLGTDAIHLKVVFGFGAYAADCAEYSKKTLHPVWWNSLALISSSVAGEPIYEFTTSSTYRFTLPRYRM